MAILASDSFTRTSASTWGTSDNGAVWVPQGTGAVFSTAATYGKITGSVNVVTHAELPITHTDIEIVGRFLFSSIDGQSWAGFCVRFTDTNNYYHSRISGAGNLSISKKVAGTGTDITTYAFTPVVATWYWIRFRVIGSTLQSKYWVDGSPEPSGWRLQTTDAVIASGTYITCRHNMSTGTSYTQWDDVYAVDYTPAFYNTEVLQDTPGLSKTLTPLPDSYSVVDSASTTSETVNTAVSAIGDSSRGIGEDKPTDMSLVALADGTAVQQTAAITESIGTNYESVDVVAGIQTTEKFFPTLDSLTSTYIQSNFVAMTDPYVLIDSAGRSAEEKDTGGSEALVNSLYMVGGTYSGANSELVTDSMTQERAMYKNIAESLTNSLILIGTREQKTTDNTPVNDQLAREQDVTLTDLLLLFADGAAVLNGAFTNVVTSLDSVDATGGLSGDNKETSQGQMLVDILQLQGSYQLPEVSLSLVGTQAQEKNFSIVLGYLLSDILGQSGARSVTLYNNVTVLSALLAEVKDSAVLSLQDVSTATSIKTDSDSEVLQDTSTITSSGIQLEQLFADISGVTTKEALTTALLQLMDAIGYRQETNYDTFLGVLTTIEHILGQDVVSQSEGLVDDAGHVVADYPANLKKNVHWEIPRGTVRWETPAMVVRWQTTNNVVYWSLEE